MLASPPSDPAYYRMTVYGPLSSGLLSQIARAGRNPNRHPAAETQTRVIFTWPFDVSDENAAWEAYHGVVLAFAACIVHRVRCEFATVYGTKSVDVALMPKNIRSILPRP